MFFVRAVVKCIIEEDGKILFVQEGTGASWKPGSWALPGGKMEPKETFSEAIKREVKEETGLRIEPEGLLQIQEVIAKVGEDDRLIHYFIFVCRKRGGKLIKPDGKHVAGFKWMSGKDIEKTLKKDFAEFYYKDLFKSYFKSKPKLLNHDFIKIWNDNSNKRFKDWVEKSMRI